MCSPLRSCTTLIWSKSKGPLKLWAALNLAGRVYGIPSSSLEDGSSWSVWNTSSRTLLTLFTAFSPYSSAKCFALFTDLPRNFFSCVLSEYRRQVVLQDVCFLFGHNCTTIQRFAMFLKKSMHLYSIQINIHLLLTFSVSVSLHRCL